MRENIFIVQRQVFLSRIRLRRRQSRYTPKTKNHTQKKKIQGKQFSFFKTGIPLPHTSLSSAVLAHIQKTNQRKWFFFQDRYALRRMRLRRLLFLHTRKENKSEKTESKFEDRYSVTTYVCVVCCCGTHANKSKKTELFFQDRNSFTVYVCCCGPQQPKKKSENAELIFEETYFSTAYVFVQRHVRFRKHRIEWWRFVKDVCVV